MENLDEQKINSNKTDIVMLLHLPEEKLDFYPMKPKVTVKDPGFSPDSGVKQNII